MIDKYSNAVSGWEDLIATIEEKDKFNKSLFITTYTESFELLKSFFKAVLLPKNAAWLLCNMEVFAKHETLPNNGIEYCKKAQLLVEDLVSRVIDNEIYIGFWNYKYKVDPDSVTDEHCIVLEDNKAQVVEVAKLKKFFK